MAAKPVDLVTGELQGTVMGDHLWVAPRVGALLVVGIVVDTVELDHNTPAVGAAGAGSPSAGGSAVC